MKCRLEHFIFTIFPQNTKNRFERGERKRQKQTFEGDKIKIKHFGTFENLFQIKPKKVSKIIVLNATLE